MNLIKIFRYVIAINVILVVVFVVFLFGNKLIGDKKESQKNNFINSIENVDLEELTEEEREQLKYSNLIKGGDIDLCYSLENMQSRTICINNIALNKISETGDYEYCNYLDNELASIDDCIKRTIKDAAIKDKNIEECELLEKKEDVNHCKKNFTSYFLINSNDLNDCEILQSGEEKNNCKNTILARMLFEQKNIDCSDFSNEDISVDCQIYKENESSDEDLRMRTSCAQYSSSFFSQFCSIY